MVVHVGRRENATAIPQGYLPVFAVSTEAEADLLATRARDAGFMAPYGGMTNFAPPSGRHVGVAVELADMQDLDRLSLFSRQLAAVHRTIEADGLCRCDPTWWEGRTAAMEDDEEEPACVCGHVLDEHESGFLSPCDICDCEDYEEC